MTGASYKELCERDRERPLSSMKDYIKNRNNLKKYASAKKSEADIKVKVSEAKPEMFLAQEVKTSTSYIKEIFRVDASDLSDNEINSRNDDMSKHLQQLGNLSIKCKISFNVPIQRSIV